MMSARIVARALVVILASRLGGNVPAAQAPAGANVKAPVHASEVKRLLITHAMVIPGPAIPASGPTDILVEGGVIARMGDSTRDQWPAADATIDATGKYVMPGIVNTHMH